MKAKTERRNVYLVDLGTGNDKFLLPLAAGMIAAYAKSIPEIRESFDIELRPARDDPEILVDGMPDPAVVGFSCYMWNFGSSLRVAELLKQRYPETLVVLGGPHVPRKPAPITEFLNTHPYVDAIAKGEGEHTFADILLRVREGKGLTGIDGVGCRNDDGEAVIAPTRPRIKDLAALPSPFLDGTFDALLAEHPSLELMPAKMVWGKDRAAPVCDPTGSFLAVDPATHGTDGFFVAILERLDSELVSR